MNTDYTSLSSGTEWRLLGDLELPLSASVEDALTDWLTALLLPLTLQTDLLNKTIISAQEAVARAMYSEVSTAFGHIHLSVFVPAAFTTHGHTWGFFRIEKIDNPESDDSHPNHVIELYLYQERQ